MRTPIYTSLVYSALICTLGIGTGCVTGAGINSASIEMHQDDVHLRMAFNDQDRKYIQDYYHNYKKKYKKKYKKQLPPGLAKKDTLTPGHQKRLEKHGTLPPGLTRYYLPQDLEEKLSALPRGYIRVKAGGDIVLMNENTHVAVDIIYGVD